MSAGGTLRAMVRAGLWIAGTGSLACTLYAGRHNNSIVLIVLFAAWVVSPFAGLWLAERSAERAPAGIAASIRSSALVIMVFSLAIYGAAAIQGPSHQTTFAFLAVPAASWLAIVPLLIAARKVARR
jgi:hypothetical protein